MSDTKKNGGPATTTAPPATDRLEEQLKQTADQPSEQPPISAMLARRLAGAASGYPDGRKIWFTARYQRLDLAFNVSEPYEDRPSAPDSAFGVFGPYQTPSQPSKRNEVVRVTLELSNGETKTIDPRKVDSLFWSESALEKFVIPYYGAVGDLELAMKIRSEFTKDKVVALCHGPNTEYCLQETKDPSEQSSRFKVLVI